MFNFSSGIWFLFVFLSDIGNPYRINAKWLGNISLDVHAVTVQKHHYSWVIKTQPTQFWKCAIIYAFPASIWSFSALCPWDFSGIQGLEFSWSSRSCLHFPRSAHWLWPETIHGETSLQGHSSRYPKRMGRNGHLLTINSPFGVTGFRNGGEEGESLAAKEDIGKGNEDLSSQTKLHLMFRGANAHWQILVWIIRCMRICF